MRFNRHAITFFFLSIFFFSAQLGNAANFNPATVAQLIADVQTSNANGEDDVINLVPNMVYTITAGAGGGPFVGFGSNALPVIQPDGGRKLTINGNGATIQRDPTLFSNNPNYPCSGPGIDFRIIQVGNGPNENRVADLKLNSLIIKNGCGDEGTENTQGRIL